MKPRHIDIAGLEGCEYPEKFINILKKFKVIPTKFVNILKKFKVIPTKFVPKIT